MIKQSIKDNIIYLSIANRDFSYRIPIEKLGATIDWKIGEKETKGIEIKTVSKWAVKLFTKATAEQKHLKQFIEIIEEQSPTNNIDWKNTKTAIIVQNQYNWLVETNKTAKNKLTNEEIIESLKKKYNLD